MDARSTTLGSRMGEQVTRFPLRYALINAALFMLVVGFITQDPCIWVGSAVIAFLLMLIQMLVWRILHRFVRNKYIWACFLLVPYLFMTGCAIFDALPSTNVHRTLEAGRLADLPRSAKNVKNDHWSNLFAGDRYLSFEADQADIEAFLAASPSLHGVKPTVYSKDYQRVPYPTTSGGLDSNSAKFDYFVKQSNLVPDWWNEQITGRGRAYEIPGAELGNNFGIVIYDEEKGIVYIKVTWS